MKKIFLALMFFCFVCGFAAMAQEAEITAEDFGLEEPTLLPSHPFYFLKDWWRDVKLFFTLDPVKDAELRQTIADEKLLEIRIMAETNVQERTLERASKKYEIQQRKLEQAIEKIENVDDEETNDFTDKFFQHQLLQEKILNKLEQIVPEGTFEKIEAMRLEHIDRFQETMFKIEQQERVEERLENALNNMEGSELKDLENLEIVRAIRERVENEERNMILQRVEEKLKLNFTETIEALSATTTDIQEFFQELEGNAENQLKILQEIQEQTQEHNEIKERVQAGLEAIEEKIQAQAQEQEQIQEQMNKPEGKGNK